MHIHAFERGSDVSGINGVAAVIIAVKVIAVHRLAWRRCAGKQRKYRLAQPVYRMMGGSGVNFETFESINFFVIDGGKAVRRNFAPVLAPHPLNQRGRTEKAAVPSLVKPGRHEHAMIEMPVAENDEIALG